MPSGVPISTASMVRIRLPMIGLSRPPAPPGGGVISVNTASDSPPTPFTTQHQQDEHEPGQAEGRGADRKRRRQAIAPSPAVIARSCCHVCHAHFPAFCAIRISMSLAAASTTKVMKNRIRPRAISEEV